MMNRERAWGGGRDDDQRSFDRLYDELVTNQVTILRMADRLGIDIEQINRSATRELRSREQYGTQGREQQYGQGREQQYGSQQNGGGRETRFGQGQGQGGGQFRSNNVDIPQRGLGFRGVGPKGSQRNDDRIREDVIEFLTQHDDVDASEINVEIQRGIVTLTGIVEDKQQKLLAEFIASNIHGVNDVDNRLRVQSQGQNNVSRQERSSQPHVS
jgi:osmotically-inducible protein OsmY